MADVKKAIDDELKKTDKNLIQKNKKPNCKIRFLVLLVSFLFGL